MKELEDFDWFPVVLRRFQTEFIGTMVEKTHIYRPLVPILDCILTRHQPQAITDLCTGNANPALYLHKRLFEAPKLVLTDKFPHLEAAQFRAQPQIQVINESVDVLDMRFENNQLYMMFNAFHHFDANAQNKIMTDLQQAGSPFIFVEILQPKLFEYLKIAVTTTLGQLLLTPFVRPFSWLRLLFTYIIPINLLTVTYDGLVSVSKSKSVAQFQEVLPKNPTANYQIKVLQLSSYFFTRLTLIQGQPIHVEQT
jgi:hypothetical protein